MKKILLLSLLCIGFTSCQSQEKIDLEKITFKENPKKIVKEQQYYYEDKDPFFYAPTYGLINFKEVSYGSISFDEEHIGFLKIILNPEETKIKGINFSIEDTKKSLDLDEYLTKMYGKAIQIRLILEPKEDDWESYYWDLANPIFISKFYDMKDNKLSISLNVYIIEQDAKYYYPDHKFDRLTDFMKEHLK